MNIFKIAQVTVGISWSYMFLDVLSSLGISCTLMELDPDGFELAVVPVLGLVWLSDQKEGRVVA